MDLRRQSDAAEARDEEEVVEEEEADEDEDEEADEEEEASDADSDDEGGDDDEDAPKKKKAKAKPKAKPKKEPAKPKAKRTRAAKIVTMKAVWVVFDNSNKRLGTFDFKDKGEAEELLAKKQEEKKGTCYLQLVKEEMKAEKAEK
jgi:hypothetical protein